MTVIKEIILEILFALIPFVLFHIHYHGKAQNYSRSFILVSGSFCLILGMTFASHVTDGIFFDLRYIIMYFGLVYGGLRVGIILFLEFSLYRIYLGGEGVYAALAIGAYTFAISILIVPLYHSVRNKTLVTLMAGIVFSVNVWLMNCYVFFHDHLSQNFLHFVLVILVQNCVGTWLLMMLFQKSVIEKEIFIKHLQAEKITAIGHVAASLAHEVRNPLTAVQGFLKLIQDNLKDQEKVQQYIAICLHEVKRTEAILSEYLSISKPLSARLELVNLSELIVLIREVMLPFANMNNVELEAFVPDNPVTMLANPDEFKQVLVNFIKNAIEACSTVPHGKVVITLTGEAHQITLEIADNGVGMSPEQIKRLGSIYFSTKSTGTGLGLTFSYNVIHMMGGSIAVSSKPNGGTRFTITLPVKDAVVM